MVIISAYNKALKGALEIVKQISMPIDTSDDEAMLSLIKTSIGTKFVSRWSDLMCKLALQAVRTVALDEDGVKSVDIKRYARVEKIPGGEIEESRVLSGVMLNKDITHPKMRRRIVNPRIVLLDCPLEYKKGESQTNIEISKEADWARIQELEEEQVKAMVDRILEFKPDLVITEKGVSGAYMLPLSPRFRNSYRSKITPSTSCTRRIFPPSDACASRTTTASREPRAPPLSTALRTCASPTLAQDAASSTLRKSAMSASTPSLLPAYALITIQILHVPHRMHDAEGVHDPAAWAVERYSKRDRPESRRCDVRRAQCVLQPDPCTGRWCDRDGD